MADAEAIVVGGGPAGSTIAAALAEAGHRVILLDKAAFPRHKACSEYINAGAVALLDEMGVLAEAQAAGAHRVEAMVVHAPDGGRFAANIAGVEPGLFALGLSRYRFDHLLIERAKTSGVEVIERAHVRDLLQAYGAVTGVVATIDGQREELRAPLVIGADGRNSVVARSLGLAKPIRWPKRTGLIAHYRGASGLGPFGELHVGDGFYAGLAPLEDGLTNVAIVAPNATVAGRDGSIDDFFATSLAAMSLVAEKLSGAERVGSIRGVGSMASRAGRTNGNGYLLIGDAASFLDPFTGEGIYEAIRAALLAAPVASAALRRGDLSARSLAAYSRERRRVFTAKREVCWIVQGFISLPPAMNYVTGRLADREELGLTLSGVLGNIRPATNALSPGFLARLLRP